MGTGQTQDRTQVKVLNVPPETVTDLQAFLFPRHFGVQGGIPADQKIAHNFANQIGS